MNRPSTSADQDPDDPVSEALESLGQSMSCGHSNGGFPGSGAFADPDVMAALANLPSATGRAVPESRSQDGECLVQNESMAGEEGIRLCLEQEAVVPEAKVKPNRRGRRSFWPPLIILGVTQIAVLLVAGLMMWPGLQDKLQTLDETTGALNNVGGEARVLQKRLEVGEQRIDALLTEVVAMKGGRELNPDAIRAEFEYLGVRNGFTRLADAAIQNADRPAFDQLLKIAGETQGELHNGAMSEVHRVRFAYLNGLRSSGYALPVGDLFPSLQGKDEMQLGTDQLIKVLQNHDGAAEHRARAAYLLADHRDISAVNALVDTVARDSNLDVVREASLTFAEMTGYRGEELLDATDLVQWWRDNSSVVKLALGN